MPDKNVTTAGWVFYDGDCPLCCGAVHRFRRLLTRRGFGLRPLQSPGTAQLLGLEQRDLLREMRLLAPDGRSFGGADALVEIARHIWWAWPLWFVSRLPGAGVILQAAYRRVASKRHCFGGKCSIDRHRASTTSKCRRRPRSFLELP
ncbi:MAG: DUF393 domain-containing protein [Verrucomicrobiae bacterium]|nr:DUF393 domain-containing protein [Verrucomicrobiae bacterium]